MVAKSEVAAPVYEKPVTKTLPAASTAMALGESFKLAGVLKRFVQTAPPLLYRMVVAVRIHGHCPDEHAGAIGPQGLAIGRILDRQVIRRGRSRDNDVPAGVECGGIGGISAVFGAVETI